MNYDDDTPVWMIYKDDSGRPEPVLVAWYNRSMLDGNRFMTLRSFGTKLEAEAWLSEFWDAYWRLVA